MTVNSYYLYLLILVRTLSFMMTLPVFSMRQIPKLTKLFVGVILAYFITPLIDYSVSLDLSIFSFSLLIIQEALLGLMLGYTSMIIFLGIQSAGDLIDYVAGLKMAASYDPITGANNSVYSSLYNWVAVILFLNLDAHHYLFKAIMNSFYLFEVGSEYVLHLDLESITYLASSSFLISIQLALPVGIILFLLDVILGVVSKIIPQLNIFLLGMPLKIVASFAVHFLLVFGIVKSISYALDSVVMIVDYFIKTLG